MLKAIRGHSFSTYVKFSEKLTFLPPDVYMHVCVTGVRNAGFSENVAYVLTEWPLIAFNMEL